MPFKPTYSDPSPPDKVPPTIGIDVAVYIDPGAWRGERMGYLWQRAKVCKVFRTGGLSVEWKDRRSKFSRRLTVRATRWRYIEIPQPLCTPPSPSS